MSAKYPEWLIKKAPSQSVLVEMKALLGRLSLHSVCESAHCPNLGECFARGTATFLLMGNICTRSCRFCVVSKGKPLPLDPDEPGNVARAADQLGLKYVVLTSVTRDDLPDGGAAHFASTVAAVRKINPLTAIELLVPDFRGSHDALNTVIESHPEVVAHNMETVPRLYPEVRPVANYRRSICLLKSVKDKYKKTATKSGLMLGLGETGDEVIAAMEDLRSAECDILTLGQYLSPSSAHLPVKRYVPPEEFEEYKSLGLEMGFSSVASAPFVRSSYQAEKMLPALPPYFPA